MRQDPSSVLFFAGFGGLMLACGGAVEPTRVSDGAWSTPTFIELPGGTFEMGRLGDPLARPHSVTLSPFSLMTREVTVAEWAGVMGERPFGNRACPAVPECPPVVGISWWDAVKFANAASLRDGLTPAYAIDGDTVRWERGANGYRLPTEAEWEYAARGPDPAAWTPPSDPGWYADNAEDPQPGCEKSSEGYGFCDLLGNVAELVFDTYHPDYPKEPTTDPVHHADGSLYVGLRGGSYLSPRSELDVAKRSFVARKNEGIPPIHVGLRLARNAP